MPTILAVDTSAKSVSCAIARDGNILASCYADTGLTHSQTLMPMIENMLSITNLSLNQLDALAVNAGPGSFTGVRIGVSAVKGLAFTADLPCISVSTLESMAEAVAVNADAVICGTMDARCQQVYTALFAKDDSGVLVRLSADEAISIADLGERLRNINKPIILIGDGSEICYNTLKPLKDNLYLAPAAIRKQQASGVALVAERLFSAGESITADELLPIYLRLPQAERELYSRLSNNKE